MSSLGVALANVGASGFFHSATNALIALTGTNAKALGGALFERKDWPVEKTYRQIIHDEALEPFWQTLFSTIAVKTAEYLTPKIPQQLVMLPTQLLGSLFHWFIASPQSINSETFNGGKNLFKRFVANCHDVLVKRPTEFILDKLGLKEQGGSPIRYGLIQAGIFSLATLSQRKSGMTLPGVNVNPDDSKLVTLLKTIGFTVVEQATYMFSQTMRYWIDFRREFGKNALAKAAACVANERAIPGHILSAISACISTYFLGRFMPRTAAAQIGRFPFDFLNRMLNCHRRRATKYQFEYASLTRDGEKVKIPIAYKIKDGKRQENFRFSKRILEFIDIIFDPIRNAFLKLVEKCSGVPIKDLRKSFEINEETLRRNQQILQAEENLKDQKVHTDCT